MDKKQELVEVAFSHKVPWSQLFNNTFDCS